MKLIKLQFLHKSPIQYIGAFLIALSLFSMILNAQVKIKERMEIAPKVSGSNNTTNGEDIRRTFLLDCSAEIKITCPYVTNTSVVGGFLITCNNRIGEVDSSDAYGRIHGVWPGANFGYFPKGTEITFTNVLTPSENYTQDQPLYVPFADTISYGTFFFLWFNIYWDDPAEPPFYMEQNGMMVTINPLEIDCILVRPEKDTLALGETTQLHFTHIVDGVTVGFPAGQLFDVFLLGSGSDYGLLSVGERTGTHLTGASEPIYYTAPLSIESNSVVVQFAGATNDGGATSSIHIPPTQSLQKSEKKTLEGKELESRIAAIMKTQTECAFGEATVREPELVVVYPTDNLLEEKEITNTPTMPEIIAKAQLKNYNGGYVTFIWDITVKWWNIENDGRSFRHFTDSFTGTTMANNSALSEWNVDWQNKIRGGDDITLKVSVSIGTDSYDKTVTTPFKIVGLNPSISEVKEGLSIQEQVVAFLESSPKWKHFNSQGFPIFGDPHGYGLMQIDFPRATDEQVWNWTANKAAGKALLAEKKSYAEGYPYLLRRQALNGTIKPGYLNATDFSTDELLWKETFQRYNGGKNWKWESEDEDDPSSEGKWTQRSNTTGYGIRAWNIYT